MIYELRVYEVAPGRMADLHTRFREHTLQIFQRHGIKPVAFFTSSIGAPTDRLTYVLEFQDLAHREKAWSSFLVDPDWKAVSAESNKPGQLILRLTSQIYEPTDYSPLS